MVTCNSTLEDEGINEKELSIGITFHHLALIVTAVFGLLSMSIALYLVMRHATHYLRPLEQKHIIRILFMIPVYSINSFLALLFYKKAIYFDVLGDCYEAIAIASFFTLMCNYIAPTLHEQKDFFRGVMPKNWAWFIPWRMCQRCTGGEHKGLFRRPSSGLTWFNIIWVFVFQYCFMRVFFTVVSCLTEALNRYCENSLNPAFAHIWVSVIEGLSVTIAMAGLIQFYVQLKTELAEHKPGMKLLCIKLVIFFSFWQQLVISLLSSSSGPFQPTDKINYQDIKNGIPAMLNTIEMTVFAILHIFAFPWKRPYSISNLMPDPSGSKAQRSSSSKSRLGLTSRFSSQTQPPSFDPYAMNHDPLSATGAGYSGVPHYQGGPFGIKALLDAANPIDLVKGVARSFRWVFVGFRQRQTDSSYVQRIGGNPSAVASSKLPLNDLEGREPTRSSVPSSSFDKSADYEPTTAYGGAGASAREWAAYDEGDISNVPDRARPAIPHGPSSGSLNWDAYDDRDQTAEQRFGVMGAASYLPTSSVEDRAGLLANAAQEEISNQNLRPENSNLNSSSGPQGMHPALRKEAGQR